VKDPTLFAAGLIALSAGTFAFRLAGPVLRQRISFPPWAERLLETAAVILLAALVVTTGLTEGHHLAGLARPAGVCAGGALAWRKAPFLVVVLAAAATTAGLRLLGVRLRIQVPLHRLDLGRERPGHAGPQVGLEHQAHPRCPGRDRLDCPSFSSHNHSSERIVVRASARPRPART
jgi:branched-subunit amino acid transport protein